MEEEIWKDIPDFEGYQASNFGRIRTFNKTTIRKDNVVRHWKSRILKQKITVNSNNKNRYDARVCLWKNGKENTLLVARCIAYAFFGKSDFTINHIDGNSLNNNIENLEYCTLKENIQKGFEENLYSTPKKVLIINNETNEKLEFRSLTLGSKYIGRSKGFLSACIKNKVYEDSKYRWKIV